MVRRDRRRGDIEGRPGPRKRASTAGLRQVAGGFSAPISAGSARDAAGNLIKRRQFRLTIRIDESFGPPEARRALAVSRLADIIAMRDALVAVDRGAQAEFLMRKAAAVADDPEKFQFAIAAANVVMVRPSEKASEASSKFSTWGTLARAWCKQELAALYPNAGYAKTSGESTDEPRVEFLCKYIADVPLATFNDDDYWRAMRPARARCKTDSTFKAYAQVLRRVLKIAVELRIIAAWPLGPTCKLPLVPKGSAPVFPFLYPDEYVRLMRCALIAIEWRVLWGFIIREGLRISEAFRIRWHHLSQLPNGRWLLDVPDTKTGRALNFVLNVGTGEVLAALKRLRPDLDGPFTWLKPTNLKKAAERVREHVEQSGTTRERLLFNDGRLRRLREHDLRSTFVTWCKLAGVDNETISQHTGHETSAMIKRYNRSKATIEHLGLPAYLPLDQAMGLDVAGELAAGARVPLQLGSGETTTGAAESHQPERDGEREGARLAGAAAAPEGYAAGETIEAEGVELLQGDPAGAAGAAGAAGGVPARWTCPSWPEVPCPECARPMARVHEGRRRGWTCPSCNAAGDLEGDWLEPVTSPLHPAPGPANAQLTNTQKPAPAYDGAGACSTPGADAFGQPAAAVDTDKRPATPSPTLLPGDPHQLCAQHRPEGGAQGWTTPAGDGADLVHPTGDADEAGGYAPGALLRARFEDRSMCRGGEDPSRAEADPGETDRGIGSRDAKPLNTWTSRDTSRDTTRGGERQPIPQNDETSMFDAACARRDLNPHAQRAPEPKSEPGRPEATKGGITTTSGVPEATGSDRVSQAPVTPFLAQLQAAHRQASEEFNWTAARSLEPLIEAERVRLSNEAAAARAAPAPVRLEVVRAQREDRGGRR